MRDKRVNRLLRGGVQSEGAKRKLFVCVLKQRKERRGIPLPFAHNLSRRIAGAAANKQFTDASRTPAHDRRGGAPFLRRYGLQRRREEFSPSRQQNIRAALGCPPSKIGRRRDFAKNNSGSRKLLIKATHSYSAPGGRPQHIQDIRRSSRKLRIASEISLMDELALYVIPPTPYDSPEAGIGRHQQHCSHYKSLLNCPNLRKHLSTQNGIHFLVNPLRACISQLTCCGSGAPSGFSRPARTRVGVHTKQLRIAITGAMKNDFRFEPVAQSYSAQFGSTREVVSDDPNHRLSSADLIRPFVPAHPRPPSRKRRLTAAAPRVNIFRDSKELLSAWQAIARACGHPDRWQRWPSSVRRAVPSRPNHRFAPPHRAAGKRPGLSCQHWEQSLPRRASILLPSVCRHRRIRKTRDERRNGQATVRVSQNYFRNPLFQRVAGGPPIRLPHPKESRRSSSQGYYTGSADLPGRSAASGMMAAAH